MRFTLDSDLLRTFVAVAQTGNFTKAAERAGRTQSAVSMQMKKLEAMVGGPLFERGSRGVALTRRGGELIVDGARDASLVERFVEKPDLETAKKYLADRDYLWNAGMFISRADVLLAEIAANNPELHAGLLELAEAWDDRERRGPAVDRIWPKLPKIAIDYVVAEPAAEKGRLAVVPGHFDWDDVGDFASLAKLNSGGRKNDLAILGENARILSDAASGIVVSHTNRVISLIGVKDIVVVDTPDALLVTTSEHAQRVKGVVDALKLTGRGDVL